jgi:intein/homing endonuclease
MADKKFSLFGFKIKRNIDEPTPISFAPPSNEDGAYTVNTVDAQFGTSALDLDGSVKSEVELITRYREMAMQPEIESAIEDIVNEAIVKGDDGKSIEIITDRLKQPEKLKSAIAEEFSTILRLLNYDNMAHDIFRRYYIDGRLNYHVIIDPQNPRKGITELRYIDPRKIRKVREVIKQKDQNSGADIVTGYEEYFVYAERITAGPVTSSNSITGVKISPDSIIHINSGLMDPKKGVVLSYLQKAIRPLNQLRMIEDASLIYKICLVGDTRVKTNKGWKYIKDIQKGDVVYSFHGFDGLKETIVKKQWLTDTKQTYKVSSNHFEITGTDNHPILVLDRTTNVVEYIEIKNLVPEKHSFIYEKLNETFAYTLFPEIENITDTFNIPNYINEEFARVFGFVLGNNSFHVNEKHEYYINILTKYFGADFVNNTTANILFKKLGINKKRIPEWVFGSNNELKTSFILGISDAIGNVIFNEIADSWSTKIVLDNKQLIEDIKVIWTDLGYCSSHILHDNSWEIVLNNKTLPRFDPVLSVTKASIEDVYDIEVESEKHNFIANGIVVHNSRAPQRRIFYIDVGNLPKLKSEQYIRDMMVKYKNKLVYNSAEGQIVDDRRHLSLLEDFWIPRRCLALSTSIKLLDGRDETLETLIKEFEQGKQNWVYSVSPKGEVVPGKISWAGITRKNTEVIKVILNNGYEEIVTPDHKFILRDGTFCEAQYLTEELPLMPLYTKVSDNIHHYYNNKTKRWNYTNRILSDYISKEKQLQENVPADVSTEDYYTILKIEKLDYKIDTGTLTVDEIHEYHDYHNFALSSGIFVKNSDGKTTEITTLDSSDSFNDMSMVEYFERKLYKSLNVPVTRLDPSQAVSIGRSMEITRDELKFSKFIDKLRSKFSELFDQALRIQVVLKGICSDEEWDEFKEYITYDFIKDNNFVELKEAEIMQERLGILAIINQYTDKYYSREWVQQNVLRLNDQEILEMDKQIQKEKEKDFEQQSIEQTRQIQLKVQAEQLQQQLMPQQDIPIEAGNQEEPETVQEPTQNKQKHPYDIIRIPD